jgi:hypothetical protein
MKTILNYLQSNHLGLIIIAYLVFMGGAAVPEASLFGAGDLTTVSNPWTFEDNVTLGDASGDTLTLTGTATFSQDTTFSGGDGAIVVTTTNAATSSIEVGCTQTYATSTATPVVLQFSTANEATTTFSGTGFGLVAWQFGSCPQ